MENGDKNAGGSEVGENKSVEVEVVEERVVEGSNGLKDDAEDEVFKEAIKTQENLQQQGSKKDLVDAAAVGEERKAEMVGGLGLDSLIESPNVEKFEEAIEVPDEVGKSDGDDGEEAIVAGEVKVENMVGKNSDDEVGVPVGIDDGQTIKEVVSEETNGLTDDGLVGSQEDGVKEVTQVGAGGGIAGLTGGDEADVKSVVLENMKFEKVNFESNGLVDDGLVGSQDVEVKEVSEIITGAEVAGLTDVDEVDSKPNAVLKNKEPERNDIDSSTSEPVPTDEKLDTEDLDSPQVTEFTKEILKEAGNSQELEENSLSIENQDEKTVDLASASDGVPLKLQDDNGVELHDRNMDTVHQEGHSADSNDATLSIEEKQEDNKTEKPKDTLTVTDAEHQGFSNGEVKDSFTVPGSEHHEEKSEPKSVSSAKQLSGEGGEERIVTSEREISALSETSATEKTETIQDGATNLRTKSNKVDQPQRVGEIACEVRDNIAVPEEPEKKENIQGERGITKVNKEQEIQPAPALSSSLNSTQPSPPPARPAGLGRAAPLLEPSPRVVQHPRVNGTISHVQNQQIEDPVNGEAEESDETREKLQMIRVKFLRLAHRLGQTPHNVVVAQVLYRLGLAEQLRGRNGGRVGAFSFDRASAMAEQLEASGNEPLDFACTIMVLGKSGVGKSATINSIFDEKKFTTDAFQMGTKKVQDVVGTVQGIKVRVIDTPGLLPSWSDQGQNEKTLLNVKRFIKKTPPDIVLYFDRLDMQSRDFSDMPLLRTITDIFGASIWFNAIVVLTHAGSAPPEGPNGAASSYDMFVTSRSHVVQQAIRQAAGDMRLMNPVSLVENHSACRTNRAGQRVLPNGQVWKPHLLLLSFASKILAEANALLKLQDSPPGKPFATRTRAPPLPFLLSSLLQSRPQLKLPEEQFGEDDSLDDDLDESSDSDDESEFDELPPFRRLTKAQVEKLSKAQKKAYFDELEYREKLFMKKQLKEEKKRRKLMKKMAAAAKELPSDYVENVEEESSGAASVPIPMPDLALPASFDSDNPTHRYRYLDSSNQWLVRPVLEQHGWDHDVGYEGINAERLFVVKEKIPLSFSGQVTKDKKDANVQMEIATSIKHGEGKATSFGFDMQTVGKDLAYTLRSDTRISNFRKNKATAGLSVTLLGDALSAGMKVEDKFIANKRFQLIMTGGAMTARGDVAYGGSLEAQLRDKDHPLGRSLSTLGLSVMDWHGDLAIGCNIQSQIPVGRHTNLIARANLNNRGAGQLSLRLNSSEQLQLALIGLVPLLRKFFTFPQQLQYGQ
ncbi:translocase of chloroplast 120, chloroplastic [Pyrus x bretschneideri]|uniref:translocase of chloroplast 120, chloroplastic n=1 Tax=Pyrus x bretschneideri TaxID=225117 RepID=UPI00202E49E4|nr:translocase of chloroplast 120, chloroplastic [Pyrus x bretschneideri]